MSMNIDAIDGLSVVQEVLPGERTPLEVAAIEEWLRSIGVVHGANGPNPDDPDNQGRRSRSNSRRNSKDISRRNSKEGDRRRSRSRSRSEEAPPDQEDFYQNIRFESIDANSLLWLQGLPYGQVFYVLDGEVRIFAQYEAMKEKTMLFEHSPEYMAARAAEKKEVKMRDYFARNALGDEVARCGSGFTLGDPMCESGMLGNSAVTATTTEVLILPRYIYEATSRHTCPWRKEVLSRIKYLSALEMFLYGKPQYLINVVYQMEEVTYDHGRVLSCAGEQVQSIRVLVDGEVELRGQLPTFGEDGDDRTALPVPNRSARNTADFVPFMICGRGTFLGATELDEERAGAAVGVHRTTAVAKSQKVECLEMKLQQYLVHAKGPFDNPVVREQRKQRIKTEGIISMNPNAMHQLRLQQEGAVRIKHPILTEVSALHGPKRHLLTLGKNEAGEMPARPAVFFKAMKFHADIIDTTAKHTTGCPSPVPAHEVNVENMKVAGSFQTKLMRAARLRRETAQGASASLLKLTGKVGLQLEERWEEKSKYSSSSISTPSGGNEMGSRSSIADAPMLSSSMLRHRSGSIESLSDFSQSKFSTQGSIRSSMGSFAEEGNFDAESAPIPTFADARKATNSVSSASFESSPTVLQAGNQAVQHPSKKWPSDLNAMQQMINKANNSVATAGSKVGGLPVVSPIGLPRQTRVIQPSASRFDKWAQFPQQSVNSSPTYQRVAKTAITTPSRQRKRNEAQKRILEPVPSVLTGNVR